jgi:DMSO/TMAO reductase YedYZ heme-binding membrane subunit
MDRATNRVNSARPWSVSSPLPALGLLVSAAIGAGLPFADLSTAGGTEFMVLHSVRCALPFFLAAFTASSLAVLWPRPRTRWLLHNRRAFGLTFAIGMVWHLAFVAYFFAGFHKHLNRLALSLDLAGLAFLIALTVTSFRNVARHLSPRAWRRLHRTGVYAIWSLATYIYLLDMKFSRDPLHIAALVILLCAALLRAAAWLRTAEHNSTRLRLQRPVTRKPPRSPTV